MARWKFVSKNFKYLEEAIDRDEALQLEQQHPDAYVTVDGETCFGVNQVRRTAPHGKALLKQLKEVQRPDDHPLRPL